jgi:hypothetical protein
MYSKIDEIKRQQYYENVISKDVGYTHAHKKISMKKALKCAVISKLVVKNAKSVEKGRLQAINHGHYHRSV